MAKNVHPKAGAGTTPTGCIFIFTVLFFSKDKEYKGSDIKKQRFYVAARNIFPVGEHEGTSDIVPSTLASTACSYGR
jgi:hypothetical protein